MMVVPDLWKTSCLVPVPKKNTLAHIGGFDITCHEVTGEARQYLPGEARPEARSVIEPSLDPLQFAYQPHIGVEDAIIFLLHRAYTHLEEVGSTVRVMFFDFSSAFLHRLTCPAQE